MDQQSNNTDEKITILLAEDHHVVRRALFTHLQQNPDFSIVGEIADGEGLVDMVQRLRPDLLLMDLEMPHHEPIEVTTALRRRYPELKIVVLSAHKTHKYVIGLFRAGVHGYVLKDDPAPDTVKAIRQVMRGETWISPQVTTVLVAHVRSHTDRVRESVTEREMDVLKLMARGYRNERIGQELSISEHTVRNHVASIFTKLGVETRVEAVVFALTLGLVSLEQIATEFQDKSEET